MSLPQHADPHTLDRTAQAPYNFVSLPDAIVAAEPLPDRDRYDALRHTGVIHCSVTTETPLYTRAALEGHEYGYRRAKDKDEFFYVDPDSKQPVIPGSSLRGMLRTLVEIITYSKPQPVTKRQLFYRTVDDTSVGKAYNERTRDAIRGGFFHSDGERHWIEPCLVGRVRFDTGTQYQLFGQSTLEGRAPNRTPVWDLQHSSVWVKLGANAEKNPKRFLPVEEISQSETEDGQWGILVLSGWAPMKKGEFVFVPGGEAILSVPDELLGRFHDDDQITQWQEEAFPLGKPRGATRKKKGWLRDGEPVFYLEEKGELTFFGRAAKFRLPYVNSPRGLLPDYDFDTVSAQADFVDMAEAIFGRVDQQATQSQQIAGRVYVGDAKVTTTPASGLWAVPEGERLPKILGSPKPTTIQHYLTQDRPDAGRELWHYDSTHRTTLRGHKLYWHKEDDLPVETWAEPAGTVGGTQHTGPIRPVAAGVSFRFDIRFENLTRAELGALLWVLDLGGRPHHRLKIGMGKPYGLGTVSLSYDLMLSSRADRYKHVLSEWQPESTPADGKPFRVAFEQMMWEALPPEAKANAKAFRSLRRIGELTTLLHWPGPESSHTQYMSLSGFEERPVLPTPGEVMRQAPPKQQVTEGEALTGSELTAHVVRCEGSTIVLDVGGEEIHLPYSEMPAPGLNQKRCLKEFPPGSILRVKVETRTKKGKLRVTAKGVQQN